MIKHIGSELRVKPKPRARSARDLRSKPESKAKPEIERWRDLERGLFKQTFLSFPSGGSNNLPKMNTYQISIPEKFSFIVCVFENVVNSPLESRVVHGIVVHGSLFLDPTRPGKTLTRPDPRLPKSLTRPDPTRGPTLLSNVHTLIE